MAIMIPDIISETATDGEKQIFYLLKTLLPPSYYVWYDARVKDRYPDFIVLGPDLGILVLEVKDWQLNSIQKVDNEKFFLSTSGVNKNPLNQAREYMNILVNELKKDKNLIEQYGDFKGNLNFTYGHGVIFTNINKNDFNVKFNGLLSDQFIIYSDEIKQIQEYSEQNLLLKKLNIMFIKKFNFPNLNSIQIKSIKNYLGDCIEATDIKLLDFERKLKDLESKSSTTHNINQNLYTNAPPKTSTNDKIKKKNLASLILFIPILILIFYFTENFSTGITDTNANNSSSKYTGEDLEPIDLYSQNIITLEATIEDIIYHTNGHIILLVSDSEGSNEIFINAKDTNLFPEFEIEETYEFVGIEKEYNGKKQLHLNEVYNLSSQNYNIGDYITITGEIKEIETHSNGHLIIILKEYEDDFEVFINAKDISKFSEVEINNIYVFSGFLNEYNSKIQLYTNELSNKNNALD